MASVVKTDAVMYALVTTGMFEYHSSMNDMLVSVLLPYSVDCTSRNGQGERGKGEERARARRQSKTGRHDDEKRRRPTSRGGTARTTSARTGQNDSDAQMVWMEER